MKILRIDEFLSTPSPVPPPYCGSQWRVTRSDDISTHDGRYHIEASRIEAENWLRHLAEKNWVDIGDFARAYQNASKRRLAKWHNREIAKRHPRGT